MFTYIVHESPRRRWFEGVVYSAYGDESADETQQRVFAVAGLFGNEYDWSTITPKWVERTGGKTFHAAECDSDQGTYSNITHELNKKLYTDLAQLIANSNLLGLGVAISLPDYKDLVAPMLDENPYYLCFQSVIIGLTKRSRLCIPRDRIEFTFDRNTEIEYNAGALYDRIIKLGLPEFANLMKDKVSFASRETVGIQAADLVTREAMKLLDNKIGPVRRHARMAVKVLAASKRIRFRQYTRAWCEKVVQDSSKHQYLKTEYYDWLTERGLNDTLANRLRFEDWRETILEKILPTKIS